VCYAPVTRFSFFRSVQGFVQEITKGSGLSNGEYCTKLSAIEGTCKGDIVGKPLLPKTARAYSHTKVLEITSRLDNLAPILVRIHLNSFFSFINFILVSLINDTQLVLLIQNKDKKSAIKVKQDFKS